MPATATAASQAAWAAGSGGALRGRRRAAAARRASPQPPRAFFQRLFQRPETAEAAGGLVEKPLYKPSEMVQMGPFKVRCPEAAPCLRLAARAGQRCCTRCCACAAAAAGSLHRHQCAHACAVAACTPRTRQVSPMGFGTWAWGNQLLWGYDESMDAELQVGVEGGGRSRQCKGCSACSVFTAPPTAHACACAAAAAAA